jgi:hypothetical protein
MHDTIKSSQYSFTENIVNNGLRGIYTWNGETCLLSIILKFLTMDCRHACGQQCFCSTWFTYFVPLVKNSNSHLYVALTDSCRFNA